MDICPPRSDTFHVAYEKVRTGRFPGGEAGVLHVFKALELRAGIVWGVDVVHVQDIHRWCVEQFGRPAETTWRRDGHKITFMREDYAFAFRMRWC